MLIAQDRHKVLAIKGLKDYLVLDTSDVLLICPKDDALYRQFVSDLALPEYKDIR